MNLSSRAVGVVVVVLVVVYTHCEFELQSCWSRSSGAGSCVYSL